MDELYIISIYSNSTAISGTDIGGNNISDTTIEATKDWGINNGDCNIISTAISVGTNIDSTNNMDTNGGGCSISSTAISGHNSAGTIIDSTNNMDTNVGGCNISSTASSGTNTGGNNISGTNILIALILLTQISMALSIVPQTVATLASVKTNISCTSH